MADVRSMLKNERVARRVQHKYASYSTTGTLLCTVCHLQLKSESLWDGHLRSAGHILRAQKLQDAKQESTAPDVVANDDGHKKKRKASDDDDTIRKRTKANNSSLPEGFFDPGTAESSPSPAVQPPPLPTNDLQIQIPSRPATPLKTTQSIPTRPDTNVDEDEWAAFEADIAAAEAQPERSMGHDGVVISAPAITAAELQARETAEDNKRRRERLEAEAEGDKEDAARKLEDEFEEMESLEERVRKLRQKREALRRRGSTAVSAPAPDATALQPHHLEDDDEDDEDDDDDEDDWDGFRMKG